MPPVNDRISGAIAITVNGSQTVDLSTATGMESDEAWWWGTPAYSVWYVWQPAADSYLYLATNWATSSIWVWSNLSTADSDLTALQATVADGGSLHYLDATYPESGGNNIEAHRVDGLAGHTYLIYVAEYTNAPPTAPEPVTVSWTVKAKSPGPPQPGGTGTDPGTTEPGGSYQQGPGIAWRSKGAGATTDAAWAQAIAPTGLGVAAGQVSLLARTGGVPNCETSPDGSGNYFAYVDLASLKLVLRDPSTVLLYVTPAGVDTTRPWQYVPGGVATIASMAVTPIWGTPLSTEGAEVRIFKPVDYAGVGPMVLTQDGKYLHDNPANTYPLTAGGTGGITTSGDTLAQEWSDPAGFAGVDLLHDWPVSDITEIAVPSSYLLTELGDTELVMLVMPAGVYAATPTPASNHNVNHFQLRLSAVWNLPDWQYLDDVATPDLDLGQFIAIAHPVADAHVRVTDLGGL